MQMDSTMKVNLTKLDNHRYELSGDLVFATVNQLQKEVKGSQFFLHDFCLDFLQLNNCDSAGMALLVSWLKLAKEKSLQIQFENLTEQMQQLARLSGIDHLLMGAVHDN